MLEISCWPTVSLQPTNTLSNCYISDFVSNSQWRMRELKSWKSTGKEKSASACDGKGAGWRGGDRGGSGGMKEKVLDCVWKIPPTQDPEKSPQEEEEEETAFPFIPVENH